MLFSVSILFGMTYIHTYIYRMDAGHTNLYTLQIDRDLKVRKTWASGTYSCCCCIVFVSVLYCYCCKQTSLAILVNISCL